MRVGVAHHLGWAVVVTADAQHRVVDRRRIELVGEALPTAPVHHEGGAFELHRTGPTLTDDELDRLVTSVRDSAVVTTRSALEHLAGDVGDPIVSISLRDWPDDFPTDIATRRRIPYESRADSVMYLQVLADAASKLGWVVHRYDATRVEAAATAVLGAGAMETLARPRHELGPPWNKDHRLALAATIVASAS